jgi:beta-fructofuranosidase
MDQHARWDGETIRVGSTGGFSFGVLKTVPQDVRIRMRIKPTAHARTFGLCVRGRGAYEGGCELRFEPAQKRVQFGSPANGAVAPVSGPRIDGSDFAIAGVDGLAAGFDLDLIVKNDFVDVCIDRRRTMISRRVDRPQGDRLFFFADGGEVHFENVSVASLL